MDLQRDISGSPPQADERRDDLSSHAHRQLIGYIGLVLPALLVAVAIWRDGFERWLSLESISAYYYTGAVAAFVGMLVALALFLFTYRGYGNEHHRADRLAAVIAGAAALGVAFFPTAAPEVVPPLEWWTPASGIIHHICAVLLFSMFAVFALWLFRLSPPGEAQTSGKLWRNRIYLGCGLAILASMAWAVASGLAGGSIFVPESIALAAFSLSWLVKGYAHRSIAGAARALLRR
jgi:hypothetical protein